MIRFGLLLVASIAFFAILGLLISFATAPVAFYAGEFQEWLAERIGGTWATVIAGAIGTVAVIGTAFGVVAAIVLLVERLGRRRR